MRKRTFGAIGLAMTMQTAAIAEKAPAGFADPDVTPFSVEEHPKERGLVAVLHGTSKTAKPMWLLGHLDVVEAKRADWTRDPFRRAWTLPGWML